MAKNDPCWEGYKQIGTKIKNGKKVPNCVPSEDTLVLKKSKRVFSTREQARIIRSEALAILEKVNEFSSTSRRVSKKSAYKVISRSLHASRDLPFSIRKHQALSDLSDYITLAKHNKVNGFKSFNTDLLPVSHPRSTKVTTMTASAMLEAQMRWVIDDPRITDDNAKALIASAMMSHPDSPEHIYTMKRIELLPQGTVSLEALVAAYGDGNSRAARSARAKLQRRDRKGRFAEMFGTFKLILGLRDGGKASATGRILGQNIFSPDLLDMELSNGRIAAVPISQGEQPEAFLDDVSPEAREKGYVRASDMDIDGNAPVVDEDSLVFMDAPSGFREDKDYRGSGKKYTDEAFDVTVFDKPSPETRDVIDAAIKRSRELDIDDPKQIKLGEDGKLWDPDRKLFAVNRRGEKTQFAFAQNWKDALEETRRREKLDEQEQFDQGEDEETSSLTDQLKGSPKKKTEKKKDEKATLPDEGFKYNVPERSLELDPNYEYVPEGTEDDPAMLAAMQSDDDLQNALVDSLEPVGDKSPATGLGRLEDENGEEFEVPAEAILSAIGEQGGDQEMALAKAYDTINGNSENEKTLASKRSKDRKDKAAEPKELDEIFDEVVSEEPEEPVAEIPEEEDIELDEDNNQDMLDALDQIPALAGLSREEKQSVIDNDDYSPYIPKNEDIDFPEGMYKPLESTEKDKEEAVGLAANRQFSDDALMENLSDSIKNNGTSDVLSLDENNEFVPSPVSSEAWRDAIALRGQDANRVLKDIANGSLDLAKEKKEADSRARKKQQDAAKRSVKRRQDLHKDLGISDDTWTDYDIIRPIETVQRIFDKDPDYEQDIKDLTESYKSFLEGKDLNKYDDAEAALKEFKEAVESTTSDDEKYQNLIDEVLEAINDSLESIEGWRKRNPNPFADDATEDEADTGKVSVPETLPEGWDLVEGTDNQMVSDRKTGDVIGYLDREGAKPHWYIVTGLDDSTPEFPSFEDALNYWNDNYKDVERVYPEGTPAGEYDATQQGEEAEEILAEENKEEEPTVPPTEPPAEDSESGEEPPKKIITYKRAGKRTLLRAGKGSPFRDKDIADFLSENGFEWSDTVERDGKTINVKAQTAMQDDEEFKAFARELRDRFNIDLQPRPATAVSPAQEPIDIDAPAPEKPEEAPTPEVIEPTPTPEEVTPTPTTEPEEVTPEVVEPTPETPEVEPTPEETPTEVEPTPEVSPRTEEEQNFVRKTVALIYDQIGKALALAKADKGISALEGLSDKQLYDLFGPFNVLKLNELIKRAMESDKESIYGDRKDMISKLMWLKWKAGFKKDESPFIQKSMDEYENSLMRTSTEDLKIMLDLLYDEMDAKVAEENEKKERKRQLKEARDKRRKEIEDRIIEEAKDKPVVEPTPEPEPEPTPEPTSEEVAEAERKRILDEIRAKKKREREDKLIEEDKKAKEEESTPEASKPIKTSVRGADLQPGDVLTKDFFTITNVEGGFKKPIKGEEVPASRVSGYYPNSVEQSSKLWADDTMFEIYRGVTPPEKGELPELRQPRKEDFSDRKDYIKAREDYDKELASRKSTWTEPEVEVAPEPASKPKTGAHVITDVARNLQPNDIAFTRNETTGDPEQFFVITEIVEGTKDYTRPDNGKIEKKTTVRGFYPGHEMQENDWNEETPIEVIRGESVENLPKAGDKPAIERIANGTLKGKAYQEKRAEIVAARKEAGKDYKPSITAEDIPSVRVNKPKYRPDRPAFTGSAAELGKLNDGPAISEALKGKRVVIMDFETVGTGRFDHDDPDAPIQIAGAVYENGEKVDEINLFINPGVPLDNFYRTQDDHKTPYLDEDGNPAINPSKLLKSGDQDVTDEWLATQPSIAEQLKAFADWAGPDSIWVAHNAEFDVNTFEKWAAKTGVDYEISGVIDTRGLARSLYGNKGNALGQLAKKFEIEVSEEDLHNAATDIRVLKPILDRLLSEMKPDNTQFDTNARAEEYKAKLDKYNRDMAAWKAQEAADNVETKPEFGPEGSTDQVNNYSHTSVFGDEINEAWMLDDENTYAVNGGSSVLVDELRVGDFIEGRGGYVEIIDIQVDPENSDKLIVYRKSPNTGEVYVDRVEDSATPGVGWARTREIKYGEVRRRNSTVGKTEAEVKSTLPKPTPDNPTPQVEPESAPVKGEEVTDEQATKVISDAIETITSGSKPDSTVTDAIKDLNVDETIKSQIIDREGGSAYHLDANGVPLKVGDKVRNIKNGRVGTVRTLTEEFGKDKRKNYLKVKFDDANKRENAAAGSLEIIREDDGDSVLSPEPMPTDMGMSLPEEITTRGLVASRIDPTELKVGDRLDISGKTRVTAIRVGDNDVSVATKTRGSRGGGFTSFLKTDKVKVWRKPEDTPDIPMGMALPDMGAEVYDMAPLSEEGSDVPNALPEDNYEYAGEKFPPTAEQRNVITAIMTGEDVVVRALAGTGKTSTLTLAARRLFEEQPKKKVVYIAFNKTVQMEAEGKMPKNVESRTGDSIAFQGVSDAIRQKFLNQKSKTATMKLRAEDIADELGIKPTGVKLKGVEVSLSSRDIPAIIKQAVNNFAISADDEIGAKHFTEELDEVPRSFVEYANAYWDDINSPAGVFGINNAHITKIWALSSPDLGSVGSGMKTPADVIFFDEAQDINPVIAKVIADQTIQKVYVGDGNQAIYAFRGAEDQLDKTTAKFDLPLTQSFRFGPEIAGIANRFLTQLGSKYRVEGAGPKGEIVDGMENPDAVIVRTNSGGFRAMIELLDAGKVVGITKGTKDELESLVASASWLIGDQGKFKKPTMHPDLAEFKNWSEVKEAVEKGEGRKVKALYDLVVQNGIGSIRDILTRVKVVTPESEKKDLKPSSDFKKITLDQAEDGAKGSIGENINYEIKDKAIRLSGNGTFKGKDIIKEQKFRWDPTGKQWFKEVEDDLDRQKAVNDLRRAVGGFAPDAGEEEAEIDVVVTTLHKAKGLQWKNVRIFDDFWGPRTNKKTGELEMPSDEELRIGYVALTRAQEKLDPGPLKWILDYTEDEDELPKKPTAIETSMGMALPTENVTEDQFNESTVKTSEKIDPATEKVANAIIEAIERGTVPWQKPWTGGGFLPTSVATGKTYEGSNILVLWAAMEKNGWTDNRFLTYKQAEKLGGNIRRGEKGTQVIHWQPVFKEVEKPDGTKEKVFVYRPPKVITLFNAEQADNINLPAIVKGEPIPVTEGETAILEAYKDRPQILFVAQDQAFYSPTEDIIKLPQREQFKSDQSFFETLVHELAHSTGHRSRLDRTELLDNYGKHLESRGEEELIAEITVALVAARLGIKIDFENVAAYAKSWLPAVKNNPQMIVKAAKQAQKATDHMLGKQEEPEAPVDEEGNPIGSGVGSEGKTGEEIAAEKEAESENNDERTV
jgi:antirestriction protein ArdC/DNA polymerase III epsilon subunit-like protein